MAFAGDGIGFATTLPTVLSGNDVRSVTIGLFESLTKLSMNSASVSKSVSLNKSHDIEKRPAFPGMDRGSFELTLPSGRWILILACACLVALGVSGYLGWVALTSSKVAGCGGGRLFNCGHVISSRWSLWMGIPVSLLAAGLYSVLGTSLALGSSARFSPKVRYSAWVVVTLLAISAGIAAIWFISLQVFVLKHLCAYCLVAHACGLLVAGIVLRKNAIGKRATAWATGFGLIGLGILIAGQLFGEVPKPYHIETFDSPNTAPEVFDFQPPGSTPDGTDDTLFEAPVLDDENTDQSFNRRHFRDWQHVAATLLRSKQSLGSVLIFATQETTESGIESSAAGQAIGQASQSPLNASPRRLVAISGGSIKLDVAQWPISGLKDAKYIFVEMFDYSCPHCRNTHRAIKVAAEKLGGDMAVMALPIPLNANCNNGIRVTDPKFVESCEIAKLAIAVWRTAPGRFAEFHNWMFSEAVAPSYAQARGFAETLVDSQKLNAELASKVPGQYITQTVELYKRVGSGNVPKLLFPGTSIVGEFTSGESLAEIISQQNR